MSSKNYFSFLLSLAKKTAKITLELKEQGKIKKVQLPYLKEKTNKFEYKEGGISRQWTYEQVFKEEWLWEEIVKNVVPEIKKLEEFALSVEKIAKVFKVNLAQSEFWVSRFVDVVAKEVLENANEDRIAELTFDFVHDLEGSPRTWTPVQWLRGIWMVDDVVEISETIRFRKPLAADLDREWDLRMFPFFQQSAQDWLVNQPSAILESSFRAKNQPEVHKEIEKLILALRLFRVGSITSVRTSWRSESIISLGMGGVSFGSGQLSENHKYSLSMADAPKLKEFIERVVPLIPQTLYDSAAKIVDYSVIAIQRYNDSILKPEIFESRLSFAIMALEALFLKETEREELEHRLGQRVARVLSFFGYDSLEVYNTMKEAYGLRSSFVHGSPIPQEKLKAIANVHQKVIEYVRLSIVLFLLLKQAYEKDRFLSLVDHSLLSETALNKLEGILKEQCSICLVKDLMPTEVSPKS
jgi:hypothetical protein